VICDRPTVTRGHSHKLFVQQSRIEARKYFFSNRVIRSWNSLPVTPEDFSSLARFRRFLQQTDLSKFTIGSNYGRLSCPRLDVYTIVPHMMWP